jgi:hypothetical protein
MNRTFILTTAIAAVSLLSGAKSAQAGHCHGGYGYNYAPSYPVTAYGGHVHHGANPWVNPGYGHYDWHDTTHYDYVAPRIVPHYNHFHYQPGGYILHQSGHYDLHH